MSNTEFPVFGVPRETREGESRVAGHPETVKKLAKRGYRIRVERGAGVAAGFVDEEFRAENVELAGADEALGADVVMKIHKPSAAETSRLKRGSKLISLGEPYSNDGTFEKLAAAGVDFFALELVPRTSRAQSMDVLSSQANIAGYRAVLEAASRFPRFFPMMMTSAGSAKPAQVIVLGAGVAGLQAIGTARRLGAQVHAYDVRSEVKEQILSLGAKFIELEIKEQASGAGGYARELSETAKKAQQQALTDRLKKADVIITTANVPGRKAPVLITEEAVAGMRKGSVIIDMAAPSGGNCAHTDPGKTVVKNGVTIVGELNYPALMPADASSFFSRNVLNLLALMMPEGNKAGPLTLKLEDDILDACLVTHQGQVRFKRGGL